MPLYEYECTECGHRTELLQRHGDPPLDKCPQCGGPVHKLFSAPAVQFKGTGWYVTDYAGKGKKEKAAAKGGSGSGDKESKKPSAEGSSESKKTDSPKSGNKE